MLVKSLAASLAVLLGTVFGLVTVPDNAVAVPLPSALSTTLSPADYVAAGGALSVTGYLTSSAAALAAEQVEISLNGTTLSTSMTDDTGRVTFELSGLTEVPVGRLSFGLSFAGTVSHGPASTTAVVTSYLSDYPPFSGPGVRAPFFDDIGWAVGQGITTGYSDGGYRPVAPVTRAAMAAFLYRAANPAGVKPTCTVVPFPDVEVIHPFCGEIAWLAQEGISTGYGDGFRPAAAVTRGAMAAFLYRLREDVPPPTCSASTFVDVLPNVPFCGEIAWLVSKAVTSGYSDNTYRPTTAVSRQAMAAFLHRLFGDALSVPKENTVELTSADLSSIEGDPNNQQVITLVSPATAPQLGVHVMVPVGGSAPNGALGKVISVNGLLVTIEPATIDDAYDYYHLVARDELVVDDTGAIVGNARFAAAGSEFACESYGSAAPSITPSVSVVDISIDFETGLFRSPKLTVDMAVKPQLAFSAEAQVGADCTWAPPGFLWPIPGTPVLVEVGPEGSLSVSSDLATSYAVGAVLRYGFTAGVGETETHFSIDPFAQRTSANLAGSLTAGLAIVVSAKVGGVVGLSGSLGLTGTLDYESSPAIGACIGIDVALGVTLAVVVDVFVRDWSVELASGTLGEETDVWKKCDGQGTWVGTVEEESSSTWAFQDSAHYGPGYNNGSDWTKASFSSAGQGVSRSEFHSTSTWYYPAFQGSGGNQCSPSRDSLDLVFTEVPDSTFTLGSPSGSETLHMFALTDTWWTTGTYTHESRIQQAFSMPCEDGSFSQAQYASGFHIGRLAWDTCTALPSLPATLQAYNATVTQTCSGAADDSHLGQSWLYGTRTMVYKWVWSVKRGGCETSIDSDGDGIGDCEEFDTGRDPVNPAG